MNSSMGFDVLVYIDCRFIIFSYRLYLHVELATKQRGLPAARSAVSI